MCGCLGNVRPFGVGMAAQRHAVCQRNATGILNAKKQPALLFIPSAGCFFASRAAFFQRTQINRHHRQNRPQPLDAANRLAQKQEIDDQRRHRFAQ